MHSAAGALNMMTEEEMKQTMDAMPAALEELLTAALKASPPSRNLLANACNCQKLASVQDENTCRQCRCVRPALTACVAGCQGPGDRGLGRVEGDGVKP
eukprot:3289923-Rhodomonas_salina.2